ncbi:MAG: GNAT family N-acetyltransferase [Acidimicrobiales bacterium]
MATPLGQFDEADAAGIRMLAVDPVHQGRGVGSALVESCIERARTEGRSRVVLHTTERMTRAMALYEHLGFRRVPALDRQPLPEVELLAYVLELVHQGTPAFG